MPILASINLNKRINSPTTRTKLQTWLSARRIQLLCVQEPWGTQRLGDFSFFGWSPIGGNEKVFAWIDSSLELPDQKLIEKYWQRIELGYLVIHNVYLDAYQQTTRASQLKRLEEGIRNDGDRPMLIVGDFNIAPSASEGLNDRKASTFNSEIDREPLRQLLKARHLLDLGHTSDFVQWTIEREFKGKRVQFRCDLSLASDYVENKLRFQYDHSTRLGKDAFTDHSAMLIDVPVTINETKLQLELIPREPLNSPSPVVLKISPQKTAIHRKDATPIAKKLFSLLRDDPKVNSVLDYGCGYGEDVRFYRKMGLRAEGYDSFPPFGWPNKPSGKFDLVTLVFVLNVLPDPWTRLNVFREASEYVSQGGLFVVVTRSESEIKREAGTKGWRSLNDGYWSHAGRGTFQRGLDRDEILLMAKRLEFVPSSYDQKLLLPSSSTCVVLQRGS